MLSYFEILYKIILEILNITQAFTVERVGKNILKLLETV